MDTLNRRKDSMVIKARSRMLDIKQQGKGTAHL